jgi:hypothetical protein
MSLRKCEFAILVLFLLLARGAKAEEWKVHEAHMQAFELKIDKFEKEIHELAEEAKAKGDSEDATKINEEMAKTYAELVKVSDDYRAEKLHIRFKHPEKGELAERKYPSYKLPPLEDLQNDLSLDGQLNRIKDKLKTVYQIEDGPAKPVAAATPKAILSGNARKPASTEDEERITLCK